ncbi:MAG: HAMP domain-containing histidine kinase [Myxococcales bacterium]|nr:HAMP domain-containing histidine kinase [Myxococcales bacterium]
MSGNLESTVTLPWLLRLRWLFFAGQLVVLNVSHLANGHDLHWPVLLAAVATYGVSNLALAFVRPAPARVSTLMGGVLVFDGVILTVLLAASGGSTNPFTVLYLVLIALSALVLGARWTLGLTALSILAFGVLFLVPATHSMGAANQGFDNHLYGMFAAFVLAAALIAFFVGKIAHAISAQREQIASLREDAARNARLASVTTLAAGAAHELGSPLATIAVAAHEAALRVASVPSAQPIAEDLRLILLEVDRCHDILQQLSARAAHTEEPVPVALSEVARKLRDILGDSRARQLALVSPDSDPSVRVPTEQLAQSLAGLVRNAQDASGGDAPVTLTMESHADTVRITVEDHGAGIPADLLPRIGEPFFTTKEPGRGMGLGVFLARTFFESYGGRLELESTVGVGTRVIAHLPRRAV